MELDWVFRDISWNLYLIDLATTHNETHNQQLTGYSQSTLEGMLINSKNEIYSCQANEIFTISVCKLDSSGNKLWNIIDTTNTSFGGIKVCTGIDIAVDFSDNIYLVYSFYTFENDDANLDNIAFVKLNENGEIIYSKIIPKTNGSIIRNPTITIDSLNQIHLSFLQIPTMDQPNHKIFVLKLDNEGEIMNTVELANLDYNGNDKPPCLKVDLDQNIYLSFTIQGTNYEDIVIYKLDPSGNVLWLKNDEEINDQAELFSQSPKISIDSSKNVYLAYFISDDVSPYTPVVCKLNEQSELIWKISLSDYSQYRNNDIPPFIDLKVENNFIYLCSTRTMSNSNYTEIPIHKIDLNGNVIWTIVDASVNKYNGIDRTNKLGFIQINSDNEIYGLISDGFQTFFKYSPETIFVSNNQIPQHILDLSTNSTFNFQDPIAPALIQPVKIFYPLTNNQNLVLGDSISGSGVQLSVPNAQTNNKFIFAQVNPSNNGIVGITSPETQIPFIFKVLDASGLIQTTLSNFPIDLYLDNNYGTTLTLTVDSQPAGFATRQTSPPASKYHYSAVLTRGDGVFVGSGSGGQGGPSPSVGSDPHITTIFGKKYDLHPSTRNNYFLFETKEYKISSHFTGYKSGLFYDKVWIDLPNKEKIKINFNSKKIKGKSEMIKLDDSEHTNLENIKYENNTNNKSVGKFFDPKKLKKLSILSKNPVDLFIDFQTRYVHFRFPENLPPPSEMKGLIVQEN
jgi:hypothetical protein